MHCYKLISIKHDLHMLRDIRILQNLRVIFKTHLNKTKWEPFD